MQFACELAFNLVVSTVNSMEGFRPRRAQDFATLVVYGVGAALALFVLVALAYLVAGLLAETARRPVEAGRPIRSLFSSLPRAQCAVATSAPMPVWERTYCASKTSRSLIAILDLSVTENSQQQINEIGMVNSAGET